MNLDWLLEAFDNTDEAMIKRKLEDASKLMIAERTVELGHRFERDAILTGIEGGIYSDVDVAKGALK